MKIALIGAGKMGRCLAGMLLKHHQQVTLIDRDPAALRIAHESLSINTTNQLEAASNADAVLLAVPISGFEEAVCAVSQYIKPGQMVFDISSVKTMPVEKMHRYLPDAMVLGTHPIFGPGATNISNQNIVLTPTSPDEKRLARRLRLTLEGTGASVSIMTPEKHDELMAVVLGLAHYISLVAADTLLQLGNFRELSQVSGPTFRGLISFIDSVVHEDPSLYSAIQMNLSALPSIQRVFIQTAEQWAEFTKDKDASSFEARMSALGSQMKHLSGK